MRPGPQSALLRNEWLQNPAASGAVPPSTRSEAAGAEASPTTGTHVGSAGLPFLGWGEQGGAGKNVPECSRVFQSVPGSRLSQSRSVSLVRTQKQGRPRAAGDPRQPARGRVLAQASPPAAEGRGRRPGGRTDGAAEGPLCKSLRPQRHHPPARKRLRHAALSQWASRGRGAWRAAPARFQGNAERRRRQEQSTSPRL